MEWKGFSLHTEKYTDGQQCNAVTLIFTILVENPLFIIEILFKFHKTFQKQFKKQVIKFNMKSPTTMYHLIYQLLFVSHLAPAKASTTLSQGT